MSAEDTLLPLGEATADAVAGVLATLAPGAVERGAVAIVATGADPFAGIEPPAVAASVSYAGGVPGGSVFVTTIAAGRRLAAAVTGSEQPAGAAELSESELAAVSEAMNRMMAAAAGATRTLLGEQVDVTAAVTQPLAAAGGVGPASAATAHATAVDLSLFGEPSRLVQFVPEALLGGAAGGRAGAAPDAGVLRGVKLRVWAELGRAHLPVGRAVGLGRGSVVELDREVDEPVDVFANGHRIGTGRLLLVEQGEWAVQLEQLFSTDPRERTGRDDGPLPPAE